MKKYRCTICGHIYDDAKENIKFEDLPEDWVCPKCGVSKELFELMEETEEIEEVDEETINVKIIMYQLKEIFPNVLNVEFVKIFVLKKKV